MNYAQMKQTTFALIKGNGSICFVKRAVKKVYDKQTHSYNYDSIVSDGYAVRKNYDERYINGSTILSGDVQFVFVTENKEKPKTDDLICFGSEEYKVIDVQTVSPDGNTVLNYLIQARK